MSVAESDKRRAEQRKEEFRHYGRLAGHGAALVKAYRDRDYAVVATARSIKPTKDDQILRARRHYRSEDGERAISQGCPVRTHRYIITMPACSLPSHSRIYRADYAAVLASTSPGFFHIHAARHRRDGRAAERHVVQITTSLIEQRELNVRSVLASLTKGGLSAATKSLAIGMQSSASDVNR